jgi:hypothetical protein
MRILGQYRTVANLDALQVDVDAQKHNRAKTATKLAASLPTILDKAFKRES